MKDILKVQKIRHGIVIDHLPQNSAFRVLKILGIEKNFSGEISILINTKSAKYGRKDIVKIEGGNISEDHLKRIAVLSRHVTVNFIENYKVIKKENPTLPKIIVDLVECPNPQCISRVEGKSKFIVEGNLFRCAYCERVFTSDELI